MHVENARTACTARAPFSKVAGLTGLPEEHPGLLPVPPAFSKLSTRCLHYTILRFIVDTTTLLNAYTSHRTTKTTTQSGGMAPPTKQCNRDTCPACVPKRMSGGMAPPIEPKQKAQGAAPYFIYSILPQKEVYGVTPHHSTPGYRRGG